MIALIFRKNRVVFNLLLGAIAFVTAGVAGGQSAPAVMQNDTPYSTKECADYYSAGGTQSAWVSVGKNGKLTYKTLQPNGDRIVDFSHAGYKGGGVAIPRVDAKYYLNPSGHDDTAHVQAAINALSALPVGADGLRGAVLLGPGVFNISKTLTISASGVVVRGSGSKAGGTVLKVAAATPGAMCPGGLTRGHGCALLNIGNAGEGRVTTSATKIVDSYIPMGARSFKVESAAGLSVGDYIRITRPITPDWLRFMGMLPSGREKPWFAPSSSLIHEQTITAVNANAITVDVPFTDSIDLRFAGPGVTVSGYSHTSRISNVGIESLSLDAPVYVVPIGDPHFLAVRVRNVADAWIRDVAMEDFEYGIITDRGKRITIDEVIVRRTKQFDYGLPGGNPFDFAIGSDQVLVMRSKALSTHNPGYVTSPRAMMNVLYDTTVSNDVEPHRGWATGLLVDNVTARVVAFRDRTLQVGHGWSMGGGVVWNSVVGTLNIQQPPGSQNWSIGNSHPIADPRNSPARTKGLQEAVGSRVAISSLYLAQLCERLGATAVAATLGDTVPPAVWITAPRQGETVRDTITLDAFASDNQAVAGVQFKINGVNVGAEDLTPPYSVQWSAAKSTPGKHQVTAVARDAAGNVQVSPPVTITTLGAQR